MAGIAVLLGLLIWGGVFYTRTIVNAGDQTGNFLENMQSSGLALRGFIVDERPAVGMAVMLALQIMPVIISAVPSVLTSFVGGMIYGFWGGMLIAAIGAAIGTAISFYLSRLLGRRVLTLFVSKKNIDKIEKLLEGGATTVVLLFMFVAPLPKDFFAYFIGLTNMKARKFFLISAVGRIPGMLGAVYLGTLALGENPNYWLIGGVGVLGFTVSALLIAFSKKIIAYLNRRKNEPNETKAHPEHPVH